MVIALIFSRKNTSGFNPNVSGWNQRVDTVIPVTFHNHDCLPSSFHFNIIPPTYYVNKNEPAHTRLFAMPRQSLLAI